MFTLLSRWYMVCFPGTDETFVWVATGEIYFFGTCFALRKGVVQPTPLELSVPLAGVREIIAARDFVLVWHASGLYRMGIGREEQLGPYAAGVDEALVKVDYFDGRTIADVRATSHVLVLCDDGVHSFGYNFYGQVCATGGAGPGGRARGFDSQWHCTWMSMLLLAFAAIPALPRPSWQSGWNGGSDVLERPYAAGGRGRNPPPPPSPLPMFEADSQNSASAPSVPRGFTLQMFGPPLAGTIGGPWEEGGPSQTPLPPLQTRPH